MSGDIENPRVWAGADIFVAPVGTTAPTDIDTPWGGGWDVLGLLGSDGMTESRSEDSTDIKAWGYGTVRVVRSNHKRTLKFVCTENTAVVNGLVNPGSVVSSVGGVTTRTVPIPTADPRAFGFQMVDGDITTRRVVARGEVTEVGDIVYQEGDQTSYEMTITVYPVDGDVWFDITDDPQAIEGS